MEIKLGYDRIEDGKFIPNGMPSDYKYFDSIHLYQKQYGQDPTVHSMFEHLSRYKKEVGKIKGNFIYPIEQFGAIEKVIGQEDNYKDMCFLKHIKKSTLKKIKSGQGKIVIMALDESRIHLHNMVHLHTLLKKYKISSLHYLTGVNWTINDLYTEWCIKTKQEKIINIINSYEQMYLKAWDLRCPDSNTFVEKEDIDKIDTLPLRPKRFLCFNRRIKPHRYALIANFYHDDLLKDNLVSFSLEQGKDLNHYRKDDEIPALLSMNRILGKTEFKKTLQNYYDELFKMSPQTIDYPEITYVIGPGCENKEPYLETYFSVVTETTFESKSCYMSSEKIYRPMLQYQPFIVYGSPYTLKNIKECGFKTFHPLINEEYDGIESPYLRYKKV